MLLTIGPHGDTLFAVTIIAYLVSALASLGVWYRDRSAHPLLSWAVALLLMGMSSFLLFKSSTGPGLLALSLAGAFLSAALCMMWLSLLKLTRTVHMFFIAYAAVFAGSLFLFIFFVGWHLGAHQAVYSVVHSFFVALLTLMSARAALLCWRHYRQRSFMIVVVAFSTLALLHLARLTVVVAFEVNIINVETEVMFVNYARYAGTICVLIATVGLNFAMLEIELKRALQAQPGS